jgi:polysaccharide export outer membrane protein
VKVLQFRSQFVNVVGDIDQPCRLPITDTPMTVINAMSECRIIRAASVNGNGNGVNDNSLYAHRDIELVRGKEHHRADLYAIYKGQDPLLYEPLLGGDTLYVRDDRWNRVFVVGEVTRQASIYIPVSGLSLADALNDKDIGGLNQQTADTRNIYVFRGAVSKSDAQKGQVSQATFHPEIYHLNVKSADALLLADQFQLRPRDIVFASAAPLVSYSRTASLIIPTISTLLQTGILIHTTRLAGPTKQYEYCRLLAGD